MVREITGKHVLIGMLVAFGIVFAVNGVFLYYALTSFSGIETQNAYRQGLAFNERIEAARAQTEKGLDIVVTRETLGPREDRIVLAFADAAGTPLAVTGVSGKVYRPASAHFDQPLTFDQAAPGRFIAQVDDMADGVWEVRIAATGPDGELLQARRRLWRE